MKTKFLTTILLASFIQVAQAQSQNDCSFSQVGFSANFGQVIAGNIAEVVTTINVKCIAGKSYTLSPANDVKIIPNGNENVEIRIYTNSNYTNQLTKDKPINGVGTGEFVAHNIYLKATSSNPNAPDFGKGKVLINGATINTPIQFQLDY